MTSLRAIAGAAISPPAASMKSSSYYQRSHPSSDMRRLSNVAPVGARVIHFNSSNEGNNSISIDASFGATLLLPLHIGIVKIDVLLEWRSCEFIR
jgi:hypothetical protein